MSRRRAGRAWLSPVAAGALALSLAACGGSGVGGSEPEPDEVAEAAGTSDAGTGGDGCALVAVEEVEAATGFTVTGQEDLFGGCRWTIEQVDPDMLESAISWQPFDAEQIDSQRQAGEVGMDVADIPGIGDEAITVGAQAGDNPMGEVWVRVGETSFRVTNEFSTARYAGSLDRQTALAALIAAKLG